MRTPKLEKCARFSRDWETALDHLGKAVEMLRQLSNGVSMPPGSLPQIQRELADAHFLRGEVYMARYRQTASSSDRDNAALDFRASLLLDDELGQDSSETASRVRDLNKEPDFKWTAK